MDPQAAPVPIDTLLAQRAWVRLLARSLVRDDSAADDVAQDAWVAALAHPPKDEATSRGWFAVVVRNVARARGRSDARRVAREEAVARPETQPTADEVVAQAEIHRRVVEETMALAEPYRTTILLRYFEGLALGEIAARMSAPLETVRTRLRRAHEQLRERLGSLRDGDERAALLVLAAGTGGTAGSGGASQGQTAAWRVFMQVASAAALVAGLITTAVIVFDKLPPGPGGAGAGAAAVPPAPRARGGAPVPPVPARRDDGAAPAAPADDKSAPAPAPAKPTADPAGTLRLRIATDPAIPRSGDACALVATFENGGTGRVKFFVPELAGSEPFPAWRLVAEDGTAFVPASWVGQSMWQTGLQGSLVELGPGETWTCRTDVSDFSPVDAAGQVDDWHVRVPLRPGRYVVSATYGKSDHYVPWSDKAFEVTQHTVDDLWNGTVRSPEVAVQVEKAAVPTLTIDAPHEVVPGRAFVVEASIDNPGAKEMEFAGALVCRVSTKMNGSLVTYRPAPEDLTGGADAVTATGIRVPGGASVRLKFDLGRIGDFTSRDVKYVYVAATIETDPDAATLRSNALFRTVKPPPDASAAGLRLAASARRGANGEPLVEVTLRNAGTSALRVPRDLASPAAIRFVVRRRDVPPGESRLISISQGGGTRTSETVAWKIVAPSHEGPANGDDFVELLPGTSQTRAFDLSDAQNPPLPSGAYELTAVWLNFDRGARAGLADGAVVVGELAAEPVPLDR